MGQRYLGAKGDLRVYNPYVENDDEYSTSQVALLNGDAYDYECIEAGWAVSNLGYLNTKLYIKCPLKKTHQLNYALFIYFFPLTLLSMVKKIYNCR